MSKSFLDVTPRWTADRRFMFQDEEGRWTFSSLYAYEAAYKLSITLGNTIRYFDVKRWVDCIPLLAHNPSMLGYAIEYAVINELSRHGLTLQTGLKIPQSLPLIALLPGGKPEKKSQAGIYVPLEFNHRYVDCIAVWFEELDSSKKTHIVPVQISNIDHITKHANSEEQFFKEDWELWREAVGQDKGPISWSFVWIINCKRSGTKVIGRNPYREVYTNPINSVSTVISSALEKYTP